jgi:hypothetical protein
VILLSSRPFDDEPANCIQVAGPRERELAAIFHHHLIQRDWLVEVDLDPEEQDDGETSD